MGLGTDNFRPLQWILGIFIHIGPILALFYSFLTLTGLKEPKNELKSYSCASSMYLKQFIAIQDGLR